MAELWSLITRIPSDPLSKEDFGTLEVWWLQEGDLIEDREEGDWIDGPVTQIQIRSDVDRGGRCYLKVAPGKSEKAGDVIGDADWQRIDLEIAKAVESGTFALSRGQQFNPSTDTWLFWTEWPAYNDRTDDEGNNPPRDPEPIKDVPDDVPVPPRGRPAGRGS